MVIMRNCGYSCTALHIGFVGVADRMCWVMVVGLLGRLVFSAHPLLQFVCESFRLVLVLGKVGGLRRRQGAGGSSVLLLLGGVLVVGGWGVVAVW